MDYTSHFISTKQEDPSKTYVVMIDPDGTNAHYFKPHIFESVMSQTDKWDAVSFYRNYFYDVWALRYGPYDFNTLFHRINDSSPVPIIESAIKKDVESAKLSFFPVLSSFNGLAIYKFIKTVGCKYLGRNPRDEGHIPEDCEHVSFHKCMIEKHNAKIRIYNESITGT
jgi:hypothetical protein